MPVNIASTSSISPEGQHLVEENAWTVPTNITNIIKSNTTSNCKSLCAKNNTKK